MKAVDTRSLAERLDRFLHWFFTTTPTADLECSPPKVAKPAKSLKVASRAESRRPPKRVRAHHAGPVRVTAAKSKP
jgi:hypothetical protein